MRAVYFDGRLGFPADYPRPEPGEGEALVRILVAGICNTDIEITRGYMGFRGVLGHEFVGVVEDVRGDCREFVGKRVVGEINAGCGACRWCLGGLKNHCPQRSVLGILGRDGAMADYLVLPAQNMLSVPGDVPDEEAVFAEPLAAAFEVLEQVHIRPTDRVLVMGDGKLGLLLALALGRVAPGLALLGKHPQKLAIARDSGIKNILLDDIEVRPSYDIVVEATGTASGFSMAMGLVRPMGTIVLKSTVGASEGMNLAPLVIGEVTVVGSRCGPFGPALRALSGRAVDVRPLVSGVFGFEEAARAFETARERGSLKVLLDFRG